MPRCTASRWWLPCGAMLIAGGMVVPRPIAAADLTAREVTEILVEATPGSPADLTGRDLSFLDLGGLDFKAARLTDSTFYGADLTGANLAQADLARAVLDRAILVRADFSAANLRGALIRLPHAVGSPAFDAASSPRFAGADLARARIVARIDGGDFRNADLSEAEFQPYGDFTQNTLARRSTFTACDFTGAMLRGADLSQASLRFSRFVGADFTGASLRGADLSGADLSGTKLHQADVTGADFDGAKLGSAEGLAETIGLAAALNLDRGTH